ncbi:MAG: lipase maturation factor family protein [Planctomycetota bacterium]|nr:lipase maturation factor family protein [Planctomycetota bacterium]
MRSGSAATISGWEANHKRIRASARRGWSIPLAAGTITSDPRACEIPTFTGETDSIENQAPNPDADERHAEKPAPPKIDLSLIRFRPDGKADVARLFISLLGSIYLIAFLSLAVQVRLLIGEGGLLPVRAVLPRVHDFMGSGSYLMFPTIFWAGAGDTALIAWAWVGVVLSFLLILGIGTRPVLILLWALYLSYVTAGRDFFSFQWDNLILEASVVAWFLPNYWGPWWRRGEARKPPSALSIFLLGWLFFRLYFESGLSKLLARDSSWVSLEAMGIYHETAPLPTILGWYAHQLPTWIQHLSTALSIAVELILPFALFAPRWIRSYVFVVLMGFQMSIFLTAGYGFFNPLSAILGLCLLDDGHIARLRSWLPSRTSVERRLSRPAVRGWIVWAVRWGLASLILIQSFSTGWIALARKPLPEWMMRVGWVLQPYRVANAYHLFADITHRRLEVEIAGSRDGIEWRPYRFRYKPGDPERVPGFVAPHQPRVDFQLWFFAFPGDPGRREYFNNLVMRLCERDSPVLALFEEDPFPEGPPDRVRVRLYDYRMTDSATLEETGRYWDRKLVIEFDEIYRCGSAVPPRY